MGKQPAESFKTKSFHAPRTNIGITQPGPLSMSHMPLAAEIGRGRNTTIQRALQPQFGRERPLAAFGRHFRPKTGVAPARFGVFSGAPLASPLSVSLTPERNCSRHRLKKEQKKKLKGIVSAFFRCLLRFACGNRNRTDYFGSDSGLLGTYRS